MVEFRRLGVPIVRRRARRHRGLLAAWTALIAFAIMVSLAGPRLLVDTVDAGARQAVARAGTSTDVIVRAAVGQLASGVLVPVVSPSNLLRLARLLPARLPHSLAEVSSGTTITALGPETPALRVDGAAPDVDLRLRLGMLTPDNRRALHVVDGALPPQDSPIVVAPGAPVDIAISSAVARAASLGVGSTVEVGAYAGASRPTDGSTTPVVSLRVVAIVAQSPGGDRQWLDLPHLWKPTSGSSGGISAPIEATVLTNPNGLNRAAGVYQENSTGRIRIHLDPSGFTSAIEERVDSQINALTANASSLEDLTVSGLTVSSGYSEALADYPAEARAALAQMSVAIAGLLGVAVVVVILLSRLLVRRRADEVALERARGSSLLSIAGRSAAESFAATVLAALVGYALAPLLGTYPFVWFTPVHDPLLPTIVVLVAILAAPVQTVLIARAAWNGRRSPANRQDRREIVRRAHARRIAAEASFVVLAAAALFSLTGRGLLETGTGGVDPLLAAAPLLFAVVVTIVVLRVYPWPLRGVAALGRRTRGALGILASVRAQRAMAVLPLLALTLAVALALGGGFLLDTVATGQVSASWQRTGADVRVDARLTSAQVAAAASAPGVTAAAPVRIDSAVQTRLGGNVDFPTLISVDSNLTRLVDHLPTDVLGGDAEAFRALDVSTPASARLPVVVDEALWRELGTKDIGMFYGAGLVSMHVVGVTHYEPSGFMSGPFMYVDRAALAARLPDPVAVNALFLTGPGSASAAAGLGVSASAVHSRAAWLADRRSLALVSGTEGVMLGSTAAVALLALLALIATALAGARERGLALSLMRTLGMRSGLGWWLALAELLPVVVAALLGGIVAGVGTVLLLEPSLGLQSLAGGESLPPPTVSPGVVLGLVAGAVLLLVASMLVEVLAHRRDNLSEVLRVGETV